MSDRHAVVTLLRDLPLEPKARLTSGLLWWVPPFLLPCMGPMPNHASTHCGTWRVLPGGMSQMFRLLFLGNGWADCVEIWHVLTYIATHGVLRLSSTGCELAQSSPNLTWVAMWLPADSVRPQRVGGQQRCQFIKSIGGGGASLKEDLPASQVLQTYLPVKNTLIVYFSSDFGNSGYIFATWYLKLNNNKKAVWVRG